jgi:hypothetical protein
MKWFKTHDGRFLNLDHIVTVAPWDKEKNVGLVGLSVGDEFNLEREDYLQLCKMIEYQG